MKNIILGFLIAVVCVFTIATTVPNSLMTIKPAQPKSVFIKFYSSGNSIDMREKDMKEYANRGYILKAVTDLCIVMEKY